MASINDLRITENLRPKILERFDGVNAGYRGRPFLAKRFLIFRGEGVANSQILEFWVNPSECQWKMGTRTAIDKIQGGAVHYEWPQSGIGVPSGGTILDQPVLQLSFQSGSLLPEHTNEAEATKKVTPPGIGNFYDFIALLNQPNIVDGRPNYVNIAYYSSIMPEILLQGHFTEDGVAWTDSAENPSQITSWGASFVVFSSDPPLYDKQRMMQVFTEMFKKPEPQLPESVFDEEAQALENFLLR